MIHVDERRARTEDVVTDDAAQMCKSDVPPIASGSATIARVRPKCTREFRAHGVASFRSAVW